MTIGVGVIGLGFMGATHLRAYASAHRAGFANRLVAVSALTEEALSGRVAVRGNIGQARQERLFDPGTVRGSVDPMAVLDDPEVELVSICTPTDTHADLAVAAMERGKHVLIEKPVATTLAEVRRVADAAARTGRLCMPAMCIRFWPGWDWLAARVGDGSLGAVRSAVFQRLGARPAWSEFYADDRRCGGALYDLHIHDADFVRRLFGDPVSVSSAGTREHLTTLYRFAGGPAHVTAEGGWGADAGFGFRMRYTVVFEHATADFDLARSPRLVVSRAGASEPVPIDEGMTGYDGEIRAMLAAVRAGGPSPVPIGEAVEVTRLLECELRSLELGQATAFGPDSG